MGCPEPDTFNALVADQLDSIARAALVDHAASCDECHLLLDALLGATLAEPTKTAPSSEPDRVGRYVIERRIGAGAMGVVYAARDPELERRVAIKVLRGGGSAARLRREAQLLARLHHPNVVAVYDVGEHDGQTFVAMALVDGENLRTWQAKPQPLDAVLRVIREAATGLAAAHAADLIHRDLKPDNIFVANDGSVQVGDFGLARSDGELDPAASAQGPLDLTQTGMVLGTPAYMAPEHAAGEPTAASDQFSFCVTAWEAIYGTRPFAAKTYAELRDQIVGRKLAAPTTARKVPARVHAALERGLRANPAERFPSIDALRAALAPRRRRWPWIAAAVVAAGVATAIAMHGSSNPCAASAHELDAIWSSAAQTKLASAKPIVDAYARDWLVLRRDACAAHDAAGDLRTACLKRARDALAALVATADPTGDADLLHRAALALPPLDDCRSPLQGSASPIQQVEGEALRMRVATTAIRVTLAGTDGIGELRELLATATAIGYEPAIVTASIALGDAFARDSQADAAAAVMRHALSIAEASHDDLGVARVATALGPVLIALGKLDEARTIVDLASAAIARIGGDPDLEIFVTGIRAQLAAAAGDHATAIDLASSMIAPMTARTGAGSVEVASLYVLLAREYSAAGRMDEAAHAMEQARFDDLGRAEGSGIASLLAVTSLSSKIDAAFLTGQSARAIELSRELEALGTELHEPAVELQAALALARAYEFASDGPMMVDAYRALLARLDKEPHGGAPDVRAEALEGIGRGWMVQGKPAQAIDSLRAAIAIDAAGGPTLANLGTSASVALGDALVDTGKPHEARVMIEPVVRALADDPNAMPQRRGGAEFVLARALWDDGGAADRERARALAADAERDFEAAVGRANAATNAHLAPRLEAIRAWRKRRS